MKSSFFQTIYHSMERLEYLMNLLFLAKKKWKCWTDLHPMDCSQAYKRHHQWSQANRGIIYPCLLGNYTLIASRTAFFFLDDSTWKTQKLKKKDMTLHLIINRYTTNALQFFLPALPFNAWENSIFCQKRCNDLQMTALHWLQRSRHPSLSCRKAHKPQPTSHLPRLLEICGCHRSYTTCSRPEAAH